MIQENESKIRKPKPKIHVHLTITQYTKYNWPIDYARNIEYRDTEYESFSVYVSDYTFLETNLTLTNEPW